MSQLFDQTGGLWGSGKLVGKFASTITSTSSPHGGQESTHLTTYPCAWALLFARADPCSLRAPRERTEYCAVG